MLTFFKGPDDLSLPKGMMKLPAPRTFLYIVLLLFPSFRSFCCGIIMDKSPKRTGDLNSPLTELRQKAKYWVGKDYGDGKNIKVEENLPKSTLTRVHP